MKLKAFYTKKEEIPAEYFGLFVERDGKFYLEEVEGLEPSVKIDEYRNNNIEVRRQLDDLKAQFAGIDPKKAKELWDKQQELDDAKLVKKEGVDALVNQRVEEAKRAHAEELRVRDEREKKLKSQLEKVTVEQAIVKEAASLGTLKPGAITDLVLRAQQVFKVDDNGQPVAYEADGVTKRYNREAQPMTMKDFAQLLIEKEATYLWEGNGGGGGDARKGGGAGGNGSYTGANPWDPKTTNRTEQNKLIRTQPELAKRLASQHGFQLNIIEGQNRGGSGDSGSA